MPLNTTKISFPFYAKLAFVLVSLISLAYIFVLGKQILSPLLYSFLFALLVFPLSAGFERKFGMPRSISSLLSVVVLLLCLSLILYFLATQLSNLASDWPVFKQTYATALADVQAWIAENIHINVAKQLKYLNKATSSLISSSTSIIGVTVVSLSSVLLFLVFVMFDTFFLLFYRRLMVKFLIQVFREENSKTVYEIIAQVQTIVRKYILGLLLEMGIVTAACCLAFTIIGIRYPILLGLITGIFNIIPYIGIFTALILTTLITIGTAASTTTVILVIGTIVLVHLIDSNVLLPLIVGSKVRINALITLLGVLAGEMLWGISGMFLSIPIIAISKIVFDRIETLKPWGMLLGDEKDEVQPGKLAEEVRTGEAMETSEPGMQPGS